MWWEKKEKKKPWLCSSNSICPNIHFHWKNFLGRGVSWRQKKAKGLGKTHSLEHILSAETCDRRRRAYMVACDRSVQQAAHWIKCKPQECEHEGIPFFKNKVIGQTVDAVIPLSHTKDQQDKNDYLYKLQSALQSAKTFNKKTCSANSAKITGTLPPQTKPDPSAETWAVTIETVTYYHACFNECTLLPGPNNVWT